MNALAMKEFDEMKGMPEEQKQPFQITDLGSLSWVLRKLAVIEEKKAEINALANEEIRRIESFREWEIGQLVDSETFFRGKIDEYVSRQREADPEFKKSSTPYGTVKLRKQPDKWLYDDTKLLESLKANGLTDLVRIKEEPNKADLKKRAVVQDGMVIDPNTGAVIEGVTVEGQPESVVIEL